MTKPRADRNILLGLLGRQLSFIDEQALAETLAAWTLDKSRSLAELLVECEALRPEDHALLEAVVERHLELHGSDTGRSLAALRSTVAIPAVLSTITDPDVRDSLASVGGDSLSREAIDPSATRLPDSFQPSNRFRIVQSLAAGGLGEVLVAHDEELQRDVVLKRIQGRYADEPQNRARFQLEIEVTSRLEHGGIVPIFGLGKSPDGRPFYAMRWVRGQTLQQAVDEFYREPQPARWTDERKLKFCRLLANLDTACHTVQYAHSRGVLHRDLKPSNILLGNYGDTLVVDWGLAKVFERPLTQSLQGEPALPALSTNGWVSTQQGEILGTPAYMSPEQAGGRLDLMNPASDVYALGATLYTVLTGRIPFAESDVGVVLQQVQRGDFPKPSQVRPALPKALESICLRAMALRPEDRYPSPLALAQDIERWQAGIELSVDHEPWLGRLMGSTRWPAFALAAMVLLTVGSVVGWGATRYFALANVVGQRPDPASASSVQDLQVPSVTTTPILAVSELDAAQEMKPEHAAYWNRRGEQHIRLELFDEAYDDYTQAVLRKPDDWLAWYGRGVVQGQRKNYVAALEDYTKALALKTDLADIWNSRGVASYELKRCNDALADYARALELNDKDFNFWNNRGLAHQNLKQWELAREDFAKAIELQRTNASLWDNRGGAAFQLGEWQAAADDRTKAIELAPDKADYWSNRAQARTSLGQFAEALSDVDEAIQRAPQDANLLVQRGHIQIQMMQTDKGLADYARAIEMQPNDARYWGIRGIAYKDLGKYSEALADLSKAVELPSDGTTWLEARANLYVEQQEWTKALADFTRLTELKPTSATMWVLCGVLQNQNGAVAEALADFNKALELDPKEPSAWFQRGQIYQNQQAWDQALSDFSRAIHLKADVPNYWYERANVRTWKDDWQQAIADYTKAMEMDPNHVEYRRSRAEAYGQQEQWNEALADYLRLTELAPSDADAWSANGVALFRLSRWSEAEASFAKAIKLKPDNAVYWTSRGNCRHNLNRWDDGLADLNQGIELAADDERLWNERGMAYQRHGDWTLAVADFTSALRLDPDNVLYLRNRADTHVNARQWPEALTDLNHAIQLNPDDSELYNIRGATYNRSGQREQALLDYDRAIEIDPQQSLAWRNRGATQAMLDRWPESAESYAKAIEFGNRDLQDWSEYLLVKLVLADSQGHQQACADLLKQTIEIQDAASAYRLIVICTRVADALADLGQLNDLLSIVQQDPDAKIAARAQGLIAYRAGRFAEAAEKFSAGLLDDDESVSIHQWLFLAMAEQRCDHADQAAKWLVKATAAIGKRHTEHAASNDQGSMPFWEEQEWNMLRREAEAVVGTK